MREDVEQSFGWSNIFMPSVKQEIADHLLVPATEYQDRREGVDLTLNVKFKNLSKGIAVRLREFGYYKKYPHDFTIRYQRPGNPKVEFAKIMDGYSDFIFRGFAGDCLKVIHWDLISSDGFRYGVRNRLIQLTQKNNWDAYSTFLVFDLRKAENAVPGLTVASWKDPQGTLFDLSQYSFYPRKS